MGNAWMTPEQLYQANYSRIYQRVYGILGQREQAEDVTHDAFLKAFAALPNVASTENLSGWLYRIATNTAYDVLRKRKCRPRVESLDALDTLPGDMSTLDPDESYPLQEQVRAALAQVPALYQRILVMQALEGYSLQDIATACGLTLSNADYHVRRARQAFRQAYAKEIADDDVAA